MNYYTIDEWKKALYIAYNSITNKKERMQLNGTNRRYPTKNVR